MGADLLDYLILGPPTRAPEPEDRVFWVILGALSVVAAGVLWAAGVL